MVKHRRGHTPVTNPEPGRQERVRLGKREQRQLHALTVDLRQRFTHQKWDNYMKSYLGTYIMEHMERYFQRMQMQTITVRMEPPAHTKHTETFAPQPHRFTEHEDTVTSEDTDTETESVDSYSDMPELVRVPDDPYYHYRTGANRSRAPAKTAQTVPYTRAERTETFVPQPHRFSERTPTSKPLQGASVAGPEKRINYYRAGANRSRAPATTAQTVPYTRAERTERFAPQPHRFAEHTVTSYPDPDSHINLADVPGWVLNPIDECYHHTTGVIRRQIGRHQSVTLFVIDGHSAHI